MSLAALALRICAVKALDGATSAGARVYDSDVDPRDLAADEAAPAILVYTDTGKIDVDGFDLASAARVVDLTIDTMVARRVTVAAGTDDERATYACADTDAGHEVYLGTLAWEVERALLAATPWAELFRSLVYRASHDSLSEFDRGATAEKGRRFALRRTVYRIETIGEPIAGAALTPMWDEILSAFEADAELADLGAYLRALITSPAAPDWLQAKQALGLSLGGIRAIGLAPVFETATEPAPAATEGEVEATDRDTILAVPAEGAATLRAGEAGMPVELDEVAP